MTVSSTSSKPWNQPLVDPSFYRVPGDVFLSKPHALTPLDPSPSSSSSSSPIPPADQTNHDSIDSGSESEWSFDEEEVELVTLDLGNEKTSRRALLGAGAFWGADADFFSTSSSGRTAPGASSRTLRSTAAATAANSVAQLSNAETTETSASSTSAGTAGVGGRKPHLATNKQFSITGLDTLLPILQIDNTVLRGKRADLLGTEIVLVDQFDASRPKGLQHRIRPIESHLSAQAQSQLATARSSTSRKRVLFTPISNRKNAEFSTTSAAATDARRSSIIDELRNKVEMTTPKRSSLLTQESVEEDEESNEEDDDHDDEEENEDLPLAFANAPTQSHDQHPHPSSPSTPRKKRPRSEHEEMVRKAERSVRRAAKQLRKDQERQAQRLQDQDQERITSLRPRQNDAGGHTDESLRTH